MKTMSALVAVMEADRGGGEEMGYLQPREHDFTNLEHEIPRVAVTGDETAPKTKSSRIPKPSCFLSQSTTEAGMLRKA